VTNHFFWIVCFETKHIISVDSMGGTYKMDGQNLLRYLEDEFVLHWRRDVHVKYEFKQLEWGIVQANSAPK
jgi:hypothetical protein